MDILSPVVTPPRLWSPDMISFSSGDESDSTGPQPPALQHSHDADLSSHSPTFDATQSLQAPQKLFTTIATTELRRLANEPTSSQNEGASPRQSNAWRMAEPLSRSMTSEDSTSSQNCIDRAPERCLRRGKRCRVRKQPFHDASTDQAFKEQDRRRSSRKKGKTSDRFHQSSQKSASLLRTTQSLFSWSPSPESPKTLPSVVSSNVQSDPLDATSNVSRNEATQAEMDAFFGFQVLPPPELLPPLPTTSATLESSTLIAEVDFVDLPSTCRNKEDPCSPSDSDADDMQMLSSMDALQNNVELEPIPKIDDATGLPLSPGERRVEIVFALERLIVSILAQLVNAVLPPVRQHTPPESQAHNPKHASANHSKRITVSIANRHNKGNQRVMRKINFPRLSGKGQHQHLGAQELSRLLKVIDIVHEGLVNDKVSTKRDLFYRDVKTFKKQMIVDSLVDDLAASLDVSRSDLNVIAASKGLFSGGLKLHMQDGSIIQSSKQGTLIPPSQLIESIEVDDKVEWILVVEKEAIFRTLTASRAFEDDQSRANGILLTGKGYPDVATRELLSLLAKKLSCDVDIFGLVDSDPHGIDILATYKHGSNALAFARDKLSVSDIRWLGLKPSELGQQSVSNDQLLPLTLRDRKKALKMLKRTELDSSWKRELEKVVHMQYKAELEVLSPGSCLSDCCTSADVEESQVVSNLQKLDRGKGHDELVDFVLNKMAAVRGRPSS
ncbi:endodeoxyribonuclease [Microbotryomycetes sp. JL221]|nr:endodeoxyribonuclease [Microbotryomycetes sp. JL221]